jgi:hypothetical protein
MRALGLRIGVPELLDCAFSDNLGGGEKNALSATRRERLAACSLHHASFGRCVAKPHELGLGANLGPGRVKYLTRA